MQSFVTYLSSHTYFNNTLAEYMMAGGVFVVTLIILFVIKYALRATIINTLKRTEHEVSLLIVDVFRLVGIQLHIIIALAVAVEFLWVEENLMIVIDHIVVLVIMIHIVLAIRKVVRWGVEEVFERKWKGDRFDPGVIAFMTNFIMVVVWAIAFIVGLENLGYKLGALVGGLGIMGVAVGFALTNVLAEVFAYFSIHMDKPFRIGDFIIVDGLMGTVRHIGLRSTRIETLEGQELIMNNKDLSSSRINNYGRMEKRRVVLHFQIVYNTPLKHIKEIIHKTEQFVRSIGDVEFDRAHFYHFGSYGLEFEVVYYIKSPDYNYYMDIQQSVDFAIMEMCEELGVKFAYKQDLDVHLLGKGEDHPIGHKK